MSSVRNRFVVESDPCLEAPPLATATEGLGSTAIAMGWARKRREFDVLVTQGWGRIAYNIVRSLSRRGLKVVLGTDEFLGMAVLSRYTAATFRHPPFILHTPEFVASLRASLLKYGPQVYIPTDQEVLVVAQFRDQLDDLGVKIPIAPFDKLRLLHRKDSALQVAASLGLPTPETIVPKTFGEMRQFARDVGDPVVVKRLSSSSARGVTHVSRAELDAANETGEFQGLPFGKFLVQRYIGGTGYGVSMLLNHGQLRAKFTHKRLRERATTGGVSTLRISVHNAQLEEHAEHLLSRAGFHGVAMVEFRYDEDLKKGWLIEVNPRFWGSLALAIHSGVDFPYLLYRMALDGDVAPVLDYRTNVQGRWILGDAVALVRQLKRNGHVAGASQEYISARSYDDLDWSDPLPFAAGFWLSAMKYWKTRGRDPNDSDLPVDRL
jgi:predicted ATP-grasp superfamily ATP-dependent carboligase